MTSIAFITTCKNRLHHIRQTLPLMMTQGADEVILVDYGCPEGSGAWAEDHVPGAKVVRVEGDPGFCTARARNAGAAQASADWLVMIDGDVCAAPGWGDWMRENLQPEHYYTCEPVNGRRGLETYGTAIIRRADFEAIGGYDEAIRGWGGEDDDLFYRLNGRGIAQADYPARFANAIHHGNEERAGWDGMGGMEGKSLLNHCYMALKLQAMAVNSGAELPLEVREGLMRGTRDALQNWIADGADRPLPLRYAIARIDPITIGRNRIAGEVAITLNITRDAPEGGPA